MNRKLTKAEKWAMWNKILNTARKAAGLPLVNPKSNPYGYIK